MKFYDFIIRAICPLMLLINLQTKAQVTIGSDKVPNQGSLLDLKMTESTGDNSTKGLLLPRVALEHIDKIDPCLDSDNLEAGDTERHIGLTVYNVTDDMKVGLCPGVHVWVGDKWVRVPEPCEDPLQELLNSPNCYIVEPNGGSVEIPVAKAFLVSEMRSDLPTLNRNSHVSIEVLWQDTQDLIDNIQLVNGDEGVYSKFRVTTKSNNAKGNALVVVRVGPNGNGTDDIAWSWHIWVTDYNPDSATPSDYGETAVTNGSIYKYKNGDGQKDYIFMDRNIGAVNTTPTDLGSMGLMYQWGRKDPFTSAKGNYENIFRDLYSFPGNSILDEIDELPGYGAPPIESGSGIKHKVAPAAALESSNLSLSIKNPMTFYYGDYVKSDYNTPFDWYTGEETGVKSDNNLWTASGDKSPFDPCPAGWRVPSGSVDYSPWNPYANAESNGGMSSTPGLSIVGINGFNLVGSTDRTVLGYYPSCFQRAHRAFSTGGAVGGSDEPSWAGGAFWAYYENDRHEAYNWTANVTENPKAKTLYLWIGMMGARVATAPQKPKAMGAFVRCVKDSK